MKTVYLAGPITGCDRDEANDWRLYVSLALAPALIQGISPLRCEPLIGERYRPHYADPKFGRANAIASKNVFDVKACDMMLAYLPQQDWPSVGTIWELGIAVGERKPTIVVCQCPRLAEHPVIQAASNWLLDDLDDAVEVILGVLGDYASFKSPLLRRTV